MLIGLRVSRPPSYCKVSHVSRASFIAAAFLPAMFGSLGERPAGLGQEHVVEARAAGLDRSGFDPLDAQRAHDLRDSGGGTVRVQPQGVLDGLAGPHTRLF